MEIKIVKISKRDKTRFDKIFSLYGQKTGFQTKTGIARQTVITILKRGYGAEYIVEKMKKYCEAQ